MSYATKLQQWLAKHGKLIFKTQHQQSLTRSYWQMALNQLFPPSCLVCQQPVSEPHTICSDCWKQLTFISRPYCVSCGTPFSYSTHSQAVCSDCLKQEEQFITIRAALSYDQLSSKLILPFKHGDKTHYAVLLAKIMSNQLRSLFSQVDLVCPVPLHWTRIWQRKYNQSALIIQHLPRWKNDHWQPVLDLLVRSKKTSSQKGLTKLERAANLENSIKINPKHLELVKNKRCLVVDDVSASGATLRTCGKILSEAGAKKVYGAVFARTVKTC